MTPIIETKKGRIEGVKTESGFVFKGVPYAKQPLGELRFRPPQEADPWEGVRACTAFAPMSVQQREAPGSFYGKEFFSYPAFDLPMSEDCLYLNIWTPEDAHNCPVAIWYHGGGFQNGHGAETEFDGMAFAKRGVILVTVNYRLGFLGYFCHPALRDKNGHSGNYGFLDQIAALDWVRENISAFGGDPGCITLFGQSAGGMAVRDLVCSPMVKGKISRAIVKSENSMTIKDVAVKVLREAGIPLTMPEIMQIIEEKQLYRFNSSNPLLILYQGIRRCCKDMKAPNHAPVDVFERFTDSEGQIRYILLEEKKTSITPVAEEQSFPVDTRWLPILAGSFPDGYILNDFLSQLQASANWQERYGEACPLEGAEIDSAMKAVGVVRDDRVFAKSEEGHQLIASICAEIAGILSKYTNVYRLMLPRWIHIV